MATHGRTNNAVSADVPHNPTARLMYYLRCISRVLELIDVGELSTLTNYSNYYRLSGPDVDALFALCILLSPDTLIGKVIFQNDERCVDGDVAFYELSNVQTNMRLPRSILIGGQTRTVNKIMFFKQSWVASNWTDPCDTSHELFMKNS